MSFSNPILAGEELVRSAIRSDNYVAGVSGWRIARDGNAEFNDVIIRGDLNVIGDDPDEYLRIYQALGVPTIEWSTGNAVWESYAADWDLGPPLVSFLKFTSGGDGGIFIMNNGEVCLVQGNLGAPGVAHDPSVGFLKHAQDFLPTTFDEWTALPGNNGYTGGSYKLLPDGNVILDGQVGGGVAASPVQVATLPVGYRPRAYLEVMVARGGAFGTNKITIDAAGVVTQWTPDATYLSSLAGIVFSTLA